MMNTRQREISVKRGKRQYFKRNLIRTDRSSVEILKLIFLLIIIYAIACLNLLSQLSQDENKNKVVGFQNQGTPKIFQRDTEVFPSKPRVFGYYFDATVLSERPPAKLPVHWENALYELYPSKRQVWWNETRQKRLQNSKDYGDSYHYPVNPYQAVTECVPMHAWQTQLFITCNTIHETGLSKILDQDNQEQVRQVGNGYFRDVYKILDYGGSRPIALKTARFRRQYDRRLFDKHRMDAMVMDRMTSSHHIMDIYGHCGVTGLFSFAEGGDLMDRISAEERVDEIEQVNLESKYLRRLIYGLDVARSIADLHTIDSFGGNSSAIVHADIHPTQFVEYEGKFKLNDFNRCHFMYWNSTSSTETCPYFYTDYNAGTFRSPEEYFYALQTEKIDIYSMGNMMYFLLEGIEPFEAVEEEHNSHFVKELVMHGVKPLLSEEISNSSLPSVLALIEAMKMCHIFDWKDRPRASQVRDYLEERLNDIQAG